MGLDGLGQPGDGGRDRQGSMDLSRHHALGHWVPVFHPQRFGKIRLLGSRHQR